MKIQSLHIVTADGYSLQCTLSAPICILCGQNAPWIVELIGRLTGAPDANAPLTDRQITIHASIELDHRNYELCYLCDPTDGDRIAVNFKKNSVSFSRADTERYLAHCAAKNTDCSNRLDGSNPLPDHTLLSESDRLIASLLCFIRRATEQAEDRPLLITNLLDRIDEATDLHPLFQALAQTGQQTFFAVSPSFTLPTADPLVQRIDTDSADAPAIPAGFEEDYQPISCPVCGSQTLDNHWICPCCGWEYDELPEDHYSAANGASLQAYRLQYQTRKKGDTP